MKRRVSVKFWIILGVAALLSVAVFSGQPQERACGPGVKPVQPPSTGPTGKIGSPAFSPGVPVVAEPSMEGLPPREPAAQEPPGAPSAQLPEESYGQVRAFVEYGKLIPIQVVQTDGRAVERPELVGATVLWNQPSDGVTGIVDQYFPDFGAGAYSADDFVAASSWNIGTIFVDGVAPGGGLLSGAVSLNWAIYGDASGLPAGYPGWGAAPLWSLSLPPTAPGVTLGGGNTQATLDLIAATGSPIHLVPGTYWLQFYPNLSLSSFGQWFWDTSSPAAGAIAQVVDPTNLLGMGWTSWTPWPTVWPTARDAAFRIDGVCREKVQDGSFEAGAVPTYWTQTSTNFGTPLCTVSACGVGTGTGPRTGSWWAWFGGIPAIEDGSVSQSVVIPPGTATLTYYTEFRVCSGVVGDFLDVLIDGNLIVRYTALDATCGALGYVLRSHDISAYADGASHTLTFHSNISSGANSNFFVDDVSISACDPPCPVITLSPSTLPGPIVGVPYTQTITAAGGTGPYTFVVYSGALPAGLTLAANGTLAGTLTSLAGSSFTVKATDANGCEGLQAYTLGGFSAFFKDDYGRSLMCVNRLTGAYTWQILTGPGVGVYTGTATVLNGGAKVVSQTGALDKLNVTYDPLRKKATGYFMTAAGAYSALSDANTANNVGGCP